MTVTHVTEEERTYDALVTVHLPNYKQPTVVKIQVKAHGLPQATEAVIAAWYAATEPKDIAIREVISQSNTQVGS